MEGEGKGGTKTLMIVGILVIAAALGAVLLYSGNKQTQIAVKAEAQTKAVDAGERIYREGINAKGEPIEAIVQGDISVSGTSFTCVSCHMRAGLGSIEGGVITTPTTGAKLFKPYQTPMDLPLTNLAVLRKLYNAPPPRPAYDDRSLINAISKGVDPTGRKLDPVMPRYILDESSMSDLVTYLKGLSSTLSPGVTQDNVSLATIVSDELTPEEKDQVVKPIANVINQRNNLLHYYQTARAGNNPSKYKMLALETDLESLRNITLWVWTLRGDPSTWRAQLEGYYAKEPVMAFLGGMTKTPWEPIHKFCEDNKIPCILPITDLPVLSDKDYYTLYHSKGYFQDGESAARYLTKVEEGVDYGKVVEVVQEGLAAKAMAEGFDKAFAKATSKEPTRVPLSGALSPDLLVEICDKHQPETLLVWADADPSKALLKLAGDKHRPKRVFVSSTLLKDKTWAIPPEARSFTYVTYPFRLPQDKKKQIIDPRRAAPPPVPDFEEKLVSTRNLAVTKLMTDVFTNMKDNYHRDYVFDLIDMMGQGVLGGQGMGMSMGGTNQADFGILSFGPGQRYASKGCYIVQLGKGKEVLAKSEWVIH